MGFEMRIAISYGKALISSLNWNLLKHVKNVLSHFMASLKPRCKHTSNGGHACLRNETSQCAYCFGSSPLSILIAEALSRDKMCCVMKLSGMKSPMPDVPTNN